ncbi:hypothetical protein CFP56_008695 [Quercus suber]|uniref:Uncharacterized protein n=1 Tax=Quercus suber TaxID=58331 RepID=A0AAW0M6S6_QUESU
MYLKGNDRTKKDGVTWQMQEAISGVLCQEDSRLPQDMKDEAPKDSLKRLFAIFNNFLGFGGEERRGEEEEEDGGGPIQVAEECHQIGSVPPSNPLSIRRLLLAKN